MKQLICGVHHLGINVPDLERARSFYERVFGFEVIGVDMWKVGNADIDAAVGVDESAAHGYMLRGANTYLELWSYEMPKSQGNPAERRASDYGITHLCFQVSDFDAALTALLAEGGTLAKPLPAYRAGGARMKYCRDPFGNIIELLELPKNAVGRLNVLAGIEQEGARTPESDKYYLMQNGSFVGFMDKTDLPKSD